MSKIKHLTIINFAIFQSQLIGLIGLLLGFIYGVGGFFYDLMTIGLNFGTFLALFALLAMPMIGIVCGFCLGVVEAVLFNIIAKVTGITLYFQK